MIVAAIMKIEENYQDDPATPILSVRCPEHVTNGGITVPEPDHTLLYTA